MWPNQTNSSSGGGGGGAGGALVFEPMALSAAEGGGRAGRLLLVAGLAVVGSVGNIFMISSIITEDHLRKRGNAFLVNAALADLLVTGVVMPASSVAILAELQEAPALCRAQWLLALVGLLVSAQTQAAMAAEGLARLALRPERYAARVTVGRVSAVALLTWATAGAAAAAHLALRLPPQPCFQSPPPADDAEVDAEAGGVAAGGGAGAAAGEAAASTPGAAAESRAHATACGAALLLGLPALIALVAYARAAVVARSALARPTCKVPVTFGWDYALLKTNVWSALLLAAAWLPVSVALALWSTAPFPGLARLLFHLAWLAMSKSCINSLLYCVTNRHFRAAYINLFHYCCCKTSVSFSRRARGGGGGSALAGVSCGGGGGGMSSCVGVASAAAEASGGGGGGGGGGSGGCGSRPAGDVRVHIIPGYNMYSYTSPQRARDGRPGGGRANGRDVYEL